MKETNLRYKFYAHPKGVDDLRISLSEFFRSLDSSFRIVFLTKEDNFQLPVTRVISYQLRDSVEQNFKIK